MEKVYLYKNSKYNYNDFYILGKKTLFALWGIVVYSEDKFWKIGEHFIWHEINEIEEVNINTLSPIIKLNILKYVGTNEN